MGKSNQLQPINFPRYFKEIINIDLKTMTNGIKPGLDIKCKTTFLDWLTFYILLMKT